MADNAKWYVVHTYSSYENSVAASIMKAVENRHMQDLIHEVKIPMETVTEITESGEAKSSNVIWYVVAVLAVLAVAALLWYLLAGRNKGARVRSASGGGSVPVQNDGEDEPEEEKEQ